LVGLPTSRRRAAREAFTEAAERQASLLGQPALGRVYVPHPIQDRTDEEIGALASDAVSQRLAAVGSHE
jgi:hypothetical protein